MHGAFPRLPDEARTQQPQRVIRTFFCCVRLKVQANAESPRFSPWFPVTSDEYLALLRREGFHPPSRGYPIQDFSSGPLEGRVICGEHQMEAWDQDLRALYHRHTEQQPSA